MEDKVKFSIFQQVSLSPLGSLFMASVLLIQTTEMSTDTMKKPSPSDGHASLTRENCPQRRFDVNVRIVEGEVVVLDRQYGQVHQLNKTASFIWGRCDGKSTIADIVDRYSKTFEIDPETAARDTSAIVYLLQKLNLLEPGFNPAICLQPEPAGESRA